MTARIFLKLLAGSLSVLAVALLAAEILAVGAAEQSYQEALELDLSSRSVTVCGLLRSGRTPDQVMDAARGTGFRLTRIDSDGRVMFDTDANAASMENHATRPEVASALKGVVKSDRRKSASLGQDFLYVAVPCEPGVLRLATRLQAVDAQVHGIRQRMLLPIALAFLPAVVVAAVFARSVSSHLGSIIEYAGRLAAGGFRERLRDPGGGELGLLGVKLNETAEELQKMYDDLQHEHQELEKQERVRKDFVMNVSHELRTPLASIQGYAETLLGGALEDRANNERFVRIIHQNAERLTTLASDLLTLSSIEQKARQFEFEPCGVNALLLDAVDSIRPLAERKQVRVRIEAAAGQCEAMVDAKAIQQALGNLLDNAVKYSPAGSEVVAGATPGPRGVEFWVRDRGPGVPVEDQPRLFERFYRVDKARSRELGGTGLGLSIVKHIAKAHEGDAGVESKPGQGARFWFTVARSITGGFTAP